MISSILLAAGMSSRMGRPKALLPWGDESLISYQVHQLVEAGADEVIVVLGHQADDIHRTIGKLPCRVMLNPRFQMGRAGSLRIGAKAVDRDADVVIILNVDQPRPASFIRSLIEAHKPESAATRPSNGDHTGHPVVVSGRLRTEMMVASDENGGLKGVLNAHATELAKVDCDDLCHLDVNTPEDYVMALSRFGFTAKA